MAISISRPPNMAQGNNSRTGMGRTSGAAMAISDISVSLGSCVPFRWRMHGSSDSGRAEAAANHSCATVSDLHRLPRLHTLLTVPVLLRSVNEAYSWRRLRHFTKLGDLTEAGKSNGPTPDFRLL